MWAWHDAPGTWGWLWMLLMMAAVWLPLLLAALWLASQFRQGPGAAPGPSAGAGADAREVARQAYARGDLDRDRFLQIIDDLERTDRPGGKGA